MLRMSQGKKTVGLGTNLGRDGEQRGGKIRREGLRNCAKPPVFNRKALNRVV